MDAGAFHKRDVRPTASAETVAEPGYQFEPRGTTADYDDIEKRTLLSSPVGLRRRHVSSSIGTCCIGRDRALVEIHRRFTPDRRAYRY
jgi:hypothetical protein